MIIGKLCFGKDDFQYGLELCLHKAGREAYSVSKKTVSAVDVLLVTCFWYRDAYLLEAFLRESGLKHRQRGHPWIIVGGIQATMSPEVFAELADYVFVGDADDHLGTILDQIERGAEPSHPSLYRSGDEAIPDPAECRPMAFAMKKGGASEVVRIEIARGCRFRCAFCALSAVKPYAEVAAQELIPLVKQFAGMPCSLFAAERLYHSEWSVLIEAMRAAKVNDRGQDARLEHLIGVGDSASVTFGLEGLSERLRRSIGKPYTDDFVCERLGEFVRSRKHVARVSMYVIADLPGEDESDWQAFRALLERIESEQWSRWLVLKPILNPLSPKRMTALASATVHPFRDYEVKWRNVLRRDGGKWGFRVVESFVFGPLDRIMDVIVQRGGRLGYEVIRRLPTALLKARGVSGDRQSKAKSILRIANQFGLDDERLGVDTSC